MPRWSKRKPLACSSLHLLVEYSALHLAASSLQLHHAPHLHFHSQRMTAPSSSLPSNTTGHCACTRTRFTLNLTNLPSDLRLSAYCHCSKCQRLNGAPFIWTTHWAESAVRWSSSTIPNEGAGKGNDGSARLIALSDGDVDVNVNVPDPSFPPSMAVYETMANRKWKLRCDHCGTPLGSWNQARRQ